jgi:hypothetical protein
MSEFDPNSVFLSVHPSLLKGIFDRFGGLGIDWHEMPPSEAPEAIRKALEKTQDKAVFLRAEATLRELYDVFSAPRMGDKILDWLTQTEREEELRCGAKEGSLKAKFFPPTTIPRNRQCLTAWIFLNFTALWNRADASVKASRITGSRTDFFQVRPCGDPATPECDRLDELQNVLAEKLYSSVSYGRFLHIKALAPEYGAQRYIAYFDPYPSVEPQYHEDGTMHAELNRSASQFSICYNPARQNIELRSLFFAPQRLFIARHFAAVVLGTELAEAPGGFNLGKLSSAAGLEEISQNRDIIHVRISAVTAAVGPAGNQDSITFRAASEGNALEKLSQQTKLKMNPDGTIPCTLILLELEFFVTGNVTSNGKDVRRLHVTLSPEGKLEIGSHDPKARQFIGGLFDSFRAAKEDADE